MSHSEPLVVILDFGSQYTQLVARRVREAGVYCEIVSCEIDELSLKQLQPLGVERKGYRLEAAQGNH